MKSKLLFLLLMCFSILSKAQVFTDSNLPIVIITTDIDNNTGLPAEILDEPKIYGSMKIIYHTNGDRNYLTDINTAAHLNYNGKIKIELKGSSSQALPKKPYSLTTIKTDNTNNNVSLLGMPQENDWILNSLAFDASLLRDYLSYGLSRDMGNYAPRGKYCEVMLNGEYIGLYILMEKLKADAGRIDIHQITTIDNAGKDLTGGYITKADKTTGNDPIAFTMPSYSGAIVNYIHHSPKPEEVTALQNIYIKNQFLLFRNAMNADNSAITNGYPSLIDVPSFVDFMIVNELSSNVDAYQLSTYFHKDKNGKLRAGPLWDLNLTYGNDLIFWGLDRSFTNVWQFDNGDNTGSRFWRDLYENSTFNCYFTKRWYELTAPTKPLHYTVISTKIDAIVGEISEAAVREETKWGMVGDHATAISDLKTWLQTRMIWMNGELTDYQACANPSVPPLVISKIHYNPPFIGNYASSDLEFIEITNNSNTTVDLTGIYFRELGITYRFPVNTSISANGKLQLASDSIKYETYYGSKPFGEYSRNLSNLSQKLVLADAFGNEIDYVEYSDNAPWPIEADGGGFSLQLIDLTYDNSLAASWMTANEIYTNTLSATDNKCFVYPNPTQNQLTITTSTEIIERYEVFDLLGQKVLGENNINAIEHSIDMKELQTNTYFVKLFFESGMYSVVKVSKE